MNILLTNDDGYNQEGINVLKDLLKNYGNVYVVAPSMAKSGASSSLTLRKKLKYVRHDVYSYELDGTPVDCVCFGLNALGVKFDLVVSGCNNGFNLSFDSVYSGTLGACFQSMVGKIKTFAFSTDIDSFEIVKENGKKVIDFIFDNNLLSNDHLLNINFPIKTWKEIKGIKITKQYFRDVTYEFHLDENEAYSFRNIIGDGDDDDYDTVATKNGYVSITPLQRTSFSDNLYKKMKGEII